ncbi:MAG: TonB-dependent receptor, partial [Polyangiaceae bacterium]|nr:TonB-dependent receptor [Polyangiaceae bacterium]
MFRSNKLQIIAPFLFACLAFEPVARADDSADEADLHFTLGVENAQQGRNREALEHFLASNRLSPNRNVVFNIARSYDKLGSYPEAFRYYNQALEGETDPAVRARIETSLTAMRPKVAIVSIKSDPPGATIYVDRKDLGARGLSPRALGLDGTRKVKVILEMPGHEPVETLVEPKVGTDTPVTVSLKRILGHVEIESQGGTVRVDQEDSKPVCGPSEKCETDIPPGRHSILVSKEGYQLSETLIDVPANGIVKVKPRLQAIIGNVVVNADVRDALITVDDKPYGFTPAVLNVSVGKHKVKITASGYRPQEQSVEVKQNDQAKLEFVMSTLEEVTAASRTAESVEDAPASVSILSGQEIRAMGYPTIAEAIRGVRGMFTSYDDVYQSGGVRGFARPGDYGNRILVMIDGHATNDNYIYSSYIGYDGRVDLDDIERIEIVRGAGSVLYGTGAFFGVINLVTKDKNNPSRFEAGVGGALGVGRVRVSTTQRLSDHSGFSLSTAVAGGTGDDAYYPEFVGQTDVRGQKSDGVVRDNDRMNGAMVQGKAWYKDLTVQAFLNYHKKLAPSGQFGVRINDPRNMNEDTRGFVEARYEPKINERLQSLTRVKMDYYAYNNFLSYPSAPDGDGNEKDAFRGLWGGLEQRFIYSPTEKIRLTAGGEYVRHFTTSQYGEDDRISDPARTTVIDRNDPFDVVAGYLLGDFTISPAFKISAGARLDYYSNAKFDFLSSFNPRIAVIAKPYTGGNIKAMFGKAFRTPSVYELFYVAAGQQAGADAGIQPEQVVSGELEYSHRFSPTVVGLVSGYANYVTNLMELGTLAPDPITGEADVQFQNSKAPVLVLGAEAEIRREWREGWMLAASYTLQRAQYLQDTNLREVPN